MSSTMIAGFEFGDKVRCHKGVVEKARLQNHQREWVESHASQRARSMGNSSEAGARRAPSENCRGMRAQLLSIIRNVGCRFYS